MGNRYGWLYLVLGLGLGAGAMTFREPTPRLALANNDRHEDYVMCTGQVMVGAGNVYSDTVWILDYRAGKLLGTIVDRNLGKLLPWAEVDLVKEFNIAPKQNVHFLMTTGNPVSGQVAFNQINGLNPLNPNGIRPIGNTGNGQTALYVAETQTGRFAVYTIGPNPDPRLGVVIRRHDATHFRPQGADQ